MKWGFQDEFVALFQKNHLPVLREEIKAGRMTAVRTFVPTYHGDGRADWTFAVVITFKDAAAMNAPSGDAEIVKRLYRIKRRSRKRSSGASRSSKRTGTFPSTSSIWLASSNRCTIRIRLPPCGDGASLRRLFSRVSVQRAQRCKEQQNENDTDGGANSAVS